MDENFCKVLKSKIDFNFIYKETKTIYSHTGKPSMDQSYSLPVLQAASMLLSIPTTGVINRIRLHSPTSPGQRARPNLSIPTGAADVLSGGQHLELLNDNWISHMSSLKGRIEYLVRLYFYSQTALSGALSLPDQWLVHT